MEAKRGACISEHLDASQAGRFAMAWVLTKGGSTCKSAALLRIRSMKKEKVLQRIGLVPDNLTGLGDIVKIPQLYICSTFRTELKGLYSGFHLEDCVQCRNMKALGRTSCRFKEFRMVLVRDGKPFGIQFKEPSKTPAAPAYPSVFNYKHKQEDLVRKQREKEQRSVGCIIKRNWIVTLREYCVLGCVSTVESTSA
ncbi:hypothetical protein JAAARDRAFT_51175 [Jaapia argillacea MUCL 33604]|uniref:Uncharacterized protein n=1 Tax=Jaapia argillacea MUCL 33604 TaxID=933084 RepID=A0A067PA12_9AGAM|nr:hypothetical protein JAAARDRAFT_51175 [Jaapia argillacea MUCL 33604]